MLQILILRHQNILLLFEKIFVLPNYLDNTWQWNHQENIFVNEKQTTYKLLDWTPWRGSKQHQSKLGRWSGYQKCLQKELQQVFQRSSEKKKRSKTWKKKHPIMIK